MARASLILLHMDPFALLCSLRCSVSFDRPGFVVVEARGCRTSEPLADDVETALTRAVQRVAEATDPPPVKTVTAARYARLLRLLLNKPRAYADLGELAGFSRSTLRDWLAPLRAARLIYVAGWSAESGGAVSPKFSWGPGRPDAPRPNATLVHNADRLPAKSRPGPAAVAAMVEALQDGATREQIAELTGLHFRTVRAYLMALRDAELIRVSDWEGDVQVLRWGPGMPSVGRPKAEPARAVTARYRERVRATSRATAVMAALKPGS